MKEIIKFLEESRVQYLATIGIDGKPKVRPFQFMLESDGKLYFCTSNKKKVYEELNQNPYLEISATSSDLSSWIRISGKAVFSDDIKIKQQIIEENPFIKSIYKSADNPIFEIFYLDEVVAFIDDFSENPPKKYK